MAERLKDKSQEKRRPNARLEIVKIQRSIARVQAMCGQVRERLKVIDSNQRDSVSAERPALDDGSMGMSVPDPHQQHYHHSSVRGFGRREVGQRRYLEGR